MGYCELLKEVNDSVKERYELAIKRVRMFLDGETNIKEPFLDYFKRTGSFLCEMDALKKRVDKQIGKDDTFEELKQYPDEDVYVVGGESIYKQLLPYCKVAHVVKLDHSYAANKFFPDLDKDEEWKLTADSDEYTYFDVAYEFLRYERTTFADS